jgi:arsenate reductase (thioredoxin)
VKQLTLRRLLCRTAALLMILPAMPSAPRAETAADNRMIVFVCLHGVVNSQMAAAYFNKAAKERGLPFTAVSRGIDLYQSIPVRIQDGLALDGLEPANPPLALTADEAARASQVLAFDTIPVEQKGSANVTYWSGVPIAIDDYETTRDEIARRVDALVATLSNEKSR